MNSITSRRYWIAFALLLACPPGVVAALPAAAARALAEHEAVHGATHASTLTLLYNEAAAAVRARRMEDALALEAELVRRIEALRAGVLSPEMRRTLFATWVGRYREYAALLALTGRHEQAFRIAELTKARTLLELSTARRALDSGLVPAAERRQIGALETRVAALDATLAQLASQPGKRVQAEIEREGVLRELAARMKALEAGTPKLAELSEVHAPGPAEARALLPAGSGYLSYLVQDNLFMVQLLSRERGLSMALPAPIPNLASSAAAFRYLLTVPAEARQANSELPRVWRRLDGSYRIAAQIPEPGAVATDDPDELADYLGEKLLGPAAALLRGARRIIVSPDGSLAMLPFEALRLGKRYLIEEHEVQYTQSMGMYALSKARAADYAGLADRRDLLSVGGAIYEQFVRVNELVSVHYSLLSPPASSLAPAGPGGADLPQVFKSMRMDWGNLPASELEVDEVAKLFDPRRSRLLKGADATEERIWQMNASGELAKYRYLHFATHGFSSIEEPRLSSVVLGQMGNRAGYDGYLTAAEWPLFDLRSDLVVVSACNTGLGYVVQGEGVMGLPFALHVAGNRNTLLTLWNVRDLSTADFVVQFFTRVQGGADHATALALTKRSFLADPRRRRPYFWAPFVLFGS